MESAQLATFKLPVIKNEPMYSYKPGSSERKKLQESLKAMRSKAPFEVSCVVDGMKHKTGNKGKQAMPTDHKTILCEYHQADSKLTEQAIEGAMKAKKEWETFPFYDRLAIFMKAADLISKKYRFEMNAATMLGQGKNAWQAEIDSAAEICDFLRFNCKYAEQLYTQQPPENSEGIWNRSEYRPLEGFVLAISPFNFTAIGGNLAAAPVLMGNVCIWKPAPNAVYSNYIIYKIFKEAGLPDGVIQFLPGTPEDVVQTALKSPDFASLHFTGSTYVFKLLWKQIGNNIDNYKSYPRIVGETGGKNFHLLHHSADVNNAVLNTIRGSFEYQGQKCSACSRVYIPDNLWDEFKEKLVKEHAKIKMGDVDDFTNFSTAVIHKASFDKIKGYIDGAKADGCEILLGGKCDDSKGYFIEPTVIVTKDPHYKTMKEEIFGPVVTIYVYPKDEYEKIFDVINETTTYALTGAIFAQDRKALKMANNHLKHSAGNFYINDKCTGAVVGQQPFGGARGSGTNDKAGSINLLYRFVSPRTIKENFLHIDEFTYPSNLED